MLGSLNLASVRASRMKRFRPNSKAFFSEEDVGVRVTASSSRVASPFGKYSLTATVRSSAWSWALYVMPYAPHPRMLWISKGPTRVPRFSAWALRSITSCQAHTQAAAHTATATRRIPGASVASAGRPLSGGCAVMASLRVQGNLRVEPGRHWPGLSLPSCVVGGLRGGGCQVIGAVTIRRVHPAIIKGRQGSVAESSAMTIKFQEAQAPRNHKPGSGNGNRAAGQPTQARISSLAYASPSPDCAPYVGMTSRAERSHRGP